MPLHRHTAARTRLSTRLHDCSCVMLLVGRRLGHAVSLDCVELQQSAGVGSHTHRQQSGQHQPLFAAQVTGTRRCRRCSRSRRSSACVSTRASTSSLPPQLFWQDATAALCTRRHGGVCSGHIHYGHVSKHLTVTWGPASPVLSAGRTQLPLTAQAPSVPQTAVGGVEPHGAS